MGFWNKFKKITNGVKTGAEIAKAVGAPIPAPVLDGLNRADRVAEVIQPDGSPVITLDDVVRVLNEQDRRITALERERK